MYMHCAVACAGRKAKKYAVKPQAAPKSVSLQLQHSMQSLTVGAAAAAAMPKLRKAEKATDGSIVQLLSAWVSDPSGVPGVADIGFVDVGDDIKWIDFELL